MYEPAFVRAGDRATADSLPPLYLPAILGQTDAAAHLLAHGAEIDGADRSGVTALHGAAAHGQVPMIQWLLDHGATIDAASPACGTPLHLAVWEGQEAAVRCLLHRGAAAQMPTCDGQLPQEFAAVRGHQHLAELLAAFIPTDNHPEWTGPIGRGANVNAATRWGITPLHRAAATGQLLIAQTLVAHGADPRAVTADGESALESALLNGHTALADWLMPFVS